MPALTLALVSTNDTDLSVVVLVDGERYEYFVRDDYHGVVKRLRRFIKLGAYGRALNFIKQRAYKCDKLS